MTDMPHEEWIQSISWIDQYKTSYLQEPPKESISIKEFAKLINMSEKTSARILKDETKFECFDVKEKHHITKYYRPINYENKT